MSSPTLADTIRADVGDDVTLGAELRDKLTDVAQRVDVRARRVRQQCQDTASFVPSRKR